MPNSDPTTPRVVSRVPASTELVAALERTDTLVPVSHDCDGPPSIEQVPSFTRCETDGTDLSSGEDGAWVAATLGA